MTTPDIAGLCERLRRKAGFNDPVTGEYVNFPTQRDGPEAADTLERQAAEIERLRGVLGGINQLARDRLALIPADLVHGSVIGQLLFDILGRAVLTGEDT
jgi:hypothetical protein